MAKDGFYKVRLPSEGLATKADGIGYVVASVKAVNVASSGHKSIYYLLS